MEIAVAVLSIAGAITLGAMSPGPSFIMVARTALAVSRTDGVAAAFGMGTGGVLFAIETGWYSIVALALSAPSPRATYLRSKSKLDRIAGGVMAALGIKLIAT
jgi:threonine/homoserine/homoserine lactone efflux protein